MNGEELLVNLCKYGDLECFKRVLNYTGFGLTNFDGINDELLSIACYHNQYELMEYIYLNLIIEDIRPSIRESLRGGNIEILDYLINTKLESLNEDYFIYCKDNRIALHLIEKYNIIPKINSKYYNVYLNKLKIRDDAVNYIINWYRHVSSRPGSRIYRECLEEWNDSINKL